MNQPHIVESKPKGKLMATAKPTTSTRRNKEPGVLSSVWHQTGNTVINTGGMVENFTGAGKDALRLTREAIKPSLIDAGVETLVAVAEGIQDLMAMGVPEADARTYLESMIK